MERCAGIESRISAIDAAQSDAPALDVLNVAGRLRELGVQPITLDELGLEAAASA
jgi:hypothetical protein